MTVNLVATTALVGTAVWRCCRSLCRLTMLVL